MEQTFKKTIDGVALLKLMGDKSDMKQAKDSLALFTAYFEEKIRAYAEVQASHLGLAETNAFQAMRCAFVKVWKYPYSFDMEKSRSKDEETAIIIWLKRIVASQLFEYAKEDLSVIENAQSFVEYHMPGMSSDKKIGLVQAFDKRLSVLDEKHKIVYLTYKAYEQAGKKLPRRLLEKLRKRLGLTQATVRVYKMEAYRALGDKPNY